MTLKPGHGRGGVGHVVAVCCCVKKMSREAKKNKGWKKNFIFCFVLSTFAISQASRGIR